MTVASKLLPYVNQIREWCEAGKTDAYIAHVLPVDISAIGVASFRLRYKIFGPRTHQSGRKYPWKEWFNGEEWTLKAGVDFHIRIQHFRSCADQAATRRRGRVVTRIVGDTITIRFKKNES